MCGMFTSLPILIKSKVRLANPTIVATIAIYKGYLYNSDYYHVIVVFVLVVLLINNLK